MNTITTTTPHAAAASGRLRAVLGLFKLRIGVVIAFTAWAGLLVTPGQGPALWRSAAVVFAVLVSSAAAGAFNQYMEVDLDRRMGRTRRRPFVTGTLTHGRHWLWLIVAMVAGSTLLAGWAANAWSALYTFLGAFFYGVVYTVWLKRRTWMNIVVGGLAGSFAVLAGAAAIDPSMTAIPLAFALVLFLWTPPHFWSLAIAYRNDYEAAGVPMLPVVAGDAASSRAILLHTVALVAASLLPAAFGMGPIYWIPAALAGAHFLRTSVALVADPGPRAAMRNFHASLMQLTVVLIAAMADALMRL
jgi:protoheme IX farnesyltransferase